MTYAIKGMSRLLERLKGRASNVSSALFDRLIKRVQKSAADKKVSVGFFESAKYPDGTPVAAVAAYNEFGSDKTPARPFMRVAIDKNRDKWGKLLSSCLTMTGGDMEKALGMAAEIIVSQIQDEIRAWRDPPNAASTIKKKGFDKPLVDTGQMLNAVSYEVGHD